MLSDYFLIHGGAHGPWCWEKVAPYLEASSRVGTVVASDLLADAQAAVGKPKQDITNSDYVEGVIQRIADLDLENLLLVGHSMAGITIPEVCHRIPGRIKRVIYLTTSNPPVGQSIADLMRHPLSPLSRNIDFDGMFCNDLDAETAAWLKGNLRDDPPLPFTDKVKYCALPTGIASTYVICTNDLALPVAFQREQAENARADELVEFHSGHSAFASRPKALAELLLQYA